LLGVWRLRGAIRPSVAHPTFASCFVSLSLRLFVPLRNVGCGRDDTLYALTPGHVAFSYLQLSFHARKRWRKFIHVLGPGETPEDVKKESEEKSKQMQQLVALHRQGVWLPSPKQVKMRTRLREANVKKLAAEQAALASMLQNGPADEEHARLKAHPMFKLRAEAEAKQAKQPAA
jgi:hypothetical protein